MGGLHPDRSVPCRPGCARNACRLIPIGSGGYPAPHPRALRVCGVERSHRLRCCGAQRIWGIRAQCHPNSGLSLADSWGQCPILSYICSTFFYSIRFEYDLVNCFRRSLASTYSILHRESGNHGWPVLDLSGNHLHTSTRYQGRYCSCVRGGYGLTPAPHVDCRLVKRPFRRGEGAPGRSMGRRRHRRRQSPARSRRGRGPPPPRSRRRVQGWRPRRSHHRRRPPMHPPRSSGSSEGQAP